MKNVYRFRFTVNATDDNEKTVSGTLDLDDKNDYDAKIEAMSEFFFENDYMIMNDRTWQSVFSEFNPQVEYVGKFSSDKQEEDDEFASKSDEEDEDEFADNDHIEEPSQADLGQEED